MERSVSARLSWEIAEIDGLSREKAWDAEEKSAPVKARIPLHRLGVPFEIVELIPFLCGQVLFIDDGYGAV